jgi:hypothetical protein
MTDKTDKTFEKKEKSERYTRFTTGVNLTFKGEEKERRYEEGDLVPVKELSKEQLKALRSMKAIHEA